MKRGSVFFYWLLAVSVLVFVLAPPVSAEPCVCYEPRAEMAGVQEFNCGVVCLVIFGDENCLFEVQDYVFLPEFVEGYEVNENHLVDLEIEETCILVADNCRFGPPYPEEMGFTYH